ncbi:DUF6596 domain-containing protein [Roseateles sp. MS17]
MEAVIRRSHGRLVALLASRNRDLAGAEDALADACAAALKDWPRELPDNPEAWLLTVARRRLIDAARKLARGEEGAAELEIIGDTVTLPADPGTLPDPRLGLLFACAHPGIAPEARAPLMLQVVLGLDAATIAASFLVAPAALAQRLVRAKAKIRAAGIPFSVPEPAELPARLEAVLDAIYACYAEAWADASGSEARWRNLREEAIWLARLLASLLPDQPEALGLLALLLYCESRRDARLSAAGDYVPLAEQDLTRWNHALLEEAEALLRQASAGGPTGRYQLEAALQSAHASGRRRGRIDWAALVALYDALMALTGSPVVALNRAVALAGRDGPDAGLAALDGLAADARLLDYQPFWAARAELLARAGRSAEAGEAYRRAIGLEREAAVRAYLQRQLAALGSG